MKKILLVLSIVCMISLIGCAKNKEENVQNNNAQILSESFEKRTEEFVKLKNEKYEADEFDGYIYAEDLIKNVRLEKVEDYYVLKADVLNPISFSTEEIQNKVKQMKNENLESIQLGEYTIYRDEKTLLDNLEYDGYEELINREMLVKGEQLINYENIPVIVLREGLPYKLIFSREKNENYIVVELMAAGASGFVVMEDVAVDAIQIKLFEDDIICITQLDGAGENVDTKVTAKEYYNNALMNKIEVNGYVYDVNNMSVSSGWHGEYMDALEIKDGEIQVFFRDGGGV